METYTNYCNYIDWVYQKLNGEINTLIPSVELVFNYDDNSSIAGSSLLCITEVYIKNVIDIIKKNNMNILEAKGFVIFTVIHELAHIDQEIDMRVMINEGQSSIYRLFIEAQNNVRAITYIKNHNEYLQRKFGDFIIPQFLTNLFKSQVNELVLSHVIKSSTDLRYNQCKSLQDKIMNTLAALFDNDIMKIYVGNRNINSISLHILNETRTESKVYHIILENVFHLGGEELRKLCRIVTSILTNNLIKCTSIGFCESRLDLLIMLKGNAKALMNVVNLS